MNNYFTLKNSVLFGVKLKEIEEKDILKKIPNTNRYLSLNKELSFISVQELLDYYAEENNRSINSSFKLKYFFELIALGFLTLFKYPYLSLKKIISNKKKNNVEKFLKRYQLVEENKSRVVKNFKKEKIGQTQIQQFQSKIIKLENEIKKKNKQIGELQSKLGSERNLNKKTELEQPKLKKWADRIKKVGKCDICESPKNLTAHHLWNKSNHPSLAYQDENGVCLCNDCHNKFHKKYTQKSQTSPAIYMKFKILEQNEIRLKTTITK